MTTYLNTIQEPLADGPTAVQEKLAGKENADSQQRPCSHGIEPFHNMFCRQLYMHRLDAPYGLWRVRSWLFQEYYQE